MEIALRVSWNFCDYIQLTKTSLRNNTDDIKGNERMALTASLCKNLQGIGKMIWNKNNNQNTLKPVCRNPRSPEALRWQIYLKRFIYTFIYFFQAEIWATKLWVSTHPTLGGYISLFFLTILCLGFFIRPSFLVVKKNAETEEKIKCYT